MNRVSTKDGPVSQRVRFATSGNANEFSHFRVSQLSLKSEFTLSSWVGGLPHRHSTMLRSGQSQRNSQISVSKTASFFGGDGARTCARASLS